MSHYIEDAIYKFVGEKNIKEKMLNSYGEEFAERLKASIIEKFREQEHEKQFTLRMSNIGLPLRQLCLQQQYGRISDSKFTISGFYGTMLEHFTLFLLRSSGINVQDTNKKTMLRVGTHKIQGELDLIIDGAVWDVKSASNYSYDVKFDSYKSLEESDSFGYLGQLFGYAMAEELPVGGWIVINKSKGLLKVVPVPISIQKAYKQRYMEEFAYKIDYLKEKREPPACTGVIKETFYGKDTGNLILNRECGWCNYKDHCHPDLIHCEDLNSKAKTKSFKHYVKIKKIAS